MKPVAVRGNLNGIFMILVQMWEMSWNQKFNKIERTVQITK